jgi:hypothetical protein
VLLRIAICLKIETGTAVLLLLLLLLLTVSGYVPGGSGTTVHNTIQYTKNTKYKHKTKFVMDKNEIIFTLW